MELAIINGIIALLDTLIPSLVKQLQAGQIAVEQQAEARARYVAFRTKMDAALAFSGPEWQPSAMIAPAVTTTTTTTKTVEPTTP